MWTEQTEVLEWLWDVARWEEKVKGCGDEWGKLGEREGGVAPAERFICQGGGKLGSGVGSACWAVHRGVLLRKGEDWSKNPQTLMGIDQFCCLRSRKGNSFKAQVVNVLRKVKCFLSQKET